MKTFFLLLLLLSATLPVSEAAAVPPVVDDEPPAIYPPESIFVVSPWLEGVAVSFNVTVIDAQDPAPIVTVTPPSGSVFAPGSNMVEITARDAAGNEARAVFFVLVMSLDVEKQVVGTAGKPIGEFNGSLLEDLPGARVYSFGVPSISNEGYILTTGRAKTDTGKLVQGILLRRAGFGDAYWSMPLRAGMPADAIEPGLLWKTFPREPFMDYSKAIGSAAVQFGFYGRVAGAGVTSANDDVLGYAVTDEPEGGLTITEIAREGGDAPGVEGGKFKSFISAGMAVRTRDFGVLPPSRSIIFTAMLQTGPRGNPGPGGVDSSNDMGLWVWEKGTLSLSLREGQMLDGRIVRSFVALKSPVGHGHGVVEDYESYHQAATGDNFTTTVLITFATGGRRLAMAGSLGTSLLVDEGVAMPWVTAGSTYGLEPYSVPWGKFASWSRHRLGGILLQTTVTNRTRGTDTVVVAGTGDADAYLFLSEGSLLPDGSMLTKIVSPVYNTYGELTFAGKTNTGVTGAWHGRPWDGIKEFFRVNDVASGTDGCVWRSMGTFARPDQMGPLFTARLRTGTTASPAPGGATTASDLGLWAVDSLGQKRLLIREGDPLYFGTQVRSFKALTNVSGSPTQTRTFNGIGEVIVWVQATDLSQYLIRFKLP